MKKFLLLFVVAFLPLFGFGQVVDLVTWNGMGTPQPDYVSTPEAISSSGLNLSSNTQGYQITGSHTVGGNNTVVNYSKYLQFKVKAAENATLDLKTFKFTYLINDGYNGSKKIHVRYSTDNFANNSTGLSLGTISTQAGQQQLASLNFPDAFMISNGQEISVRLYFYESINTHTLIIRHYVDNQNHPAGPVLSGTVSYSVPTLIPLIKWSKIDKKPTILASGVTTGTIEAQGVDGVSDGQQGQYFRRILEWNENTLNVSKYIEFSVGVDASHQVLLKNLNFEIRKAGADFKYEIRYSKDKDNFNNSFTSLLSAPASVTSNDYTNVSIPLQDLYLSPAETVYFRIYAYGSGYTQVRLRLSEGNKTGPFITGVLGGSEHCIQTTTWENGTWSNGRPTASKKVIIKSDYVIDGSSLKESMNACELTVQTGVVITVQPNYYLSVENNVINNGSIIIENNGSFVQSNNNATYTGQPTSFQIKRTTQPVFRYDFTYWSSPVQNFKLKNVSPLTLFDKFFSWNPNPGAWVIHPSTGPEVTMGIGQGYIVRAPQNLPIQAAGVVPQTPTTTFEGIPNNGVVAQNITATSNWHLLGNPYPSAVYLDQFLSDNKTKLEGTVYLWTHNSDITPNGNGSYSYSPSDYASYNLSGAVGTGRGDNAASEDNTTNNTPTGFLAAGQSFFIKSRAAGEVVFNNKMRVKGQNNQFFKPGPTEPINDWATTGKHRIWLNLTGGTNAFNQTLVGYIEGATNETDWGFDGETFGGNQVTLYSILDTKSMVIQGRALPFNNQDEVPLGYKTTLTGTLKITIDEVDGLFNGQDIYLEDKVLNIVHNLKEAEYAFTTVPGTFNDRFVLRYVPAETLGTDNPTVDANSMVIFKNGHQINVRSNDQTIEQVTVYDLLGKVIFDKAKINAQSFSTAQLNVYNQVVIVKVITDTRAEVVKKVILN